MTHTPYYRFIIKKVKERYKADQFLGEFQVRLPKGGWSGQPVAVFTAPNPDLSLGHKPYIGLFSFDDQIAITGFTVEQMEQNRYHAAIHCPVCEEVIYSRYRHDYKKCSCGNAMVDGGRDYLRFGYKPELYVNVVTLDLLTGNIIDKEPDLE